MDQKANKKTAAAKESSKKRKPASSHLETEKEVRAVGAAKKRSTSAAEPQSAERKKQTPRIDQVNDTALSDDGSFDSTTESQDVVRFTLAGQVYGLPVLQIVQVLRIVAFNVVPNPPQGMLGVIDFRGKVIPLIDLHQVFDLPTQRIGLNTPVLVARVSGRLLGLVVDEVVGVSALAVGVQVFTNGKSRGVRYISGMARVDGKTMLVVNLEELEQQFPDVVLKTA